MTKVKKPDIELYIHCKKCMKIDPEGDISSTEKLAVGWTKKGLQVFCEGCNSNIINLDFRGQKTVLI